MDALDLVGILPAMLPRLWAFSLRLTGDKHDAEDLVQLACVRGLERAYQLKQDTVPLSWMFSIVHSIWINETRSRERRKRYCVYHDSSSLENVTGPDDKNPETSLMLRQIMGAVERLPEPQRAVPLLVAVEGMSYQDTASILSIPIGTVMSRLSRARQTLGRFFGGRKVAVGAHSSSGRYSCFT